jgi:hypothetical protein
MSDMEQAQRPTRPAERRVRSWHWVWALALLALAAGLLLGPVVVLLLGAGLVAGGLWVRHESGNPRDRAIAGGLAAAGAAILVVTALLFAFLMPTSVRVEVQEEPVLDDVLAPEP